MSNLLSAYKSAANRSQVTTQQRNSEASCWLLCSLFTPCKIDVCIHPRPHSPICQSYIITVIFLSFCRKNSKRSKLTVLRRLDQRESLWLFPSSLNIQNYSPSCYLQLDDARLVIGVWRANAQSWTGPCLFCFASPLLPGLAAAQCGVTSERYMAVSLFQQFSLEECLKVTFIVFP